MRYGLIPQSAQERTALEQAPQVQALFDPFLPLLTARALVASIKLGVAQGLASGAQRADDLAAELSLDPVGLHHLLDVLAAAGYVQRRDSSYDLTPLSRLALLDGAPAALDAWILHNDLHWRAIGNLETVLTGDGLRDLHHRLDGADAWATYQRAMLQTARPVATAVAEALPEPLGRDLVLDLGGGHGLYGAAICRRWPGMRCRVVDLPEALDSARALIATEGFADVVDHVAGDLRSVDLGTATCDVVFLGNIVHHLVEDGISDFLKRLHRALGPGGVVAIWDMAPVQTDTEPDLVTAGFALLFHLTSASTCRTTAAQVGLLTAAGFVDIDVRPDLAPTHTLITARRL